MNNFSEQIMKLKLMVDYYIEDFSNSYKFMFMVAKLGINSPKDLCDVLKMAKSNLAILAGKLRFQRYIVQKNINKKEIYYEITELGLKKLEQKIADVAISDKEKVNLIARLEDILDNATTGE